MSTAKKKVRSDFFREVMDREGCRCRVCGVTDGQRHDDDSGRAHTARLDAHHVTDRSLMPNGGYVVENGIALCCCCHVKAEAHHEMDPEAEEAFAPSKLYVLIGSSYEAAIAADARR